MNTDNDISDKLNILIKLIALGLCKDKTQSEQIAFLSSAGISPKEIANLLGTTSNTVSVTLSGIKKKKKKVK